MSIGNLKDNGNKGNNFPYQLAVLKLLDQIANGGGGGGGATEATALAILGAIQNGQEFEQNLVIDTGGVGCPANCPTYLQVRIFNTETHTFDPPIYYDAAGSVVVPVGPLQLVNPQSVLNNILTQVTAVNADLDVALSTRASEASILNLLTTAVFQARINTLGQKASASSTPVVLSTEQELLLNNISTYTSAAQSAIVSTISLNSNSTTFVNSVGIDLDLWAGITIVPSVTTTGGTNGFYRIQWSFNNTDWFDETIDLPGSISGTPAECLITQGTMIRSFISSVLGYRNLASITLSKKARYIRISQRSDAAAVVIVATYNYQLFR